MAGELILIVEDNERNLKLLRDLLGAHGYRILEARSAEDALVLARAECPQLVLMDIQLPGMDGLAALRELRAASETRATPVVAVTAFAMTDDRERLLAAGFDGYLEKPVNVRELRSSIRSYIAPSAIGRMTDPPPRILVVDDKPENIRLLDAVLSPRGYTVDAVSSGAQALEKLAEEPSRPGAARHRDARSRRV